MSEPVGMTVLKVDDLTEAATALLFEPFEYAKMQATFHYDVDGTVTPAQIVGTRYKRSEVEDGSALKKHMALINSLHNEAKIFAVLGGLVNGIELTNDEYAMVSYICRRGVYGDGPEFTKYNQLIDGIMA